MEHKVVEKVPEGKTEQAPPSVGTIGQGSTWLIGLGLIGLGVLFLLNQMANLSVLIWAIALMGIGVTFAGVFLTDRSRWWALIPGYIFALTGAFLLVEPLLPDDWDAIYWLVAVGLPFLVVFLTNRSRWWALIPAYVMGTVAGFLFIEPILSESLVPAYWLFAIALPFFIVFIINTRNWWALIPGGILAAIALGFTLTVAEFFLPIILIGGGILLLVMPMIARRRQAVEPQPLSGPDADRPMT
ncbi:MAG: hypothetical protein Kow00124_14610 [Anaerolineae bacterium]